MYRFSTPTHTFKFNTEVNDFQEILITYAQNGNIILEKHKDELSFSDDGKQASFKMTQEESSLFESNRTAAIQVRVLTKTGDSFASPICKCSIEPVIHCGCLE